MSAYDSDLEEAFDMIRSTFQETIEQVRQDCSDEVDGIRDDLKEILARLKGVITAVDAIGE